ncbi:G2E3 ligase, partial [Trogon melanurus]|nr:G2E3 ligase [Trogon melanurus]
EAGATCPICIDLLEEQEPYTTLVCPACKHAWYHRRCLQEQAVSAGISCFYCPMCRNREAVQAEMLNLGIRIPRRSPLWEQSQLYTALLERHSRCDASECLCPGGRQHGEEEG